MWSQATMSTMTVTIWNRAILVALLLEKFLALYGTCKFISVSITANHRLLLLRQIFHTILPCCFMMHFNSIPLAPSSSICSVRDRFSSQKFVSLSLLSHVCHMPYLIVFDSNILAIFNEEYQSSIFWFWEVIYVCNSIRLTTELWGTRNVLFLKAQWFFLCWVFIDTVTHFYNFFLVW